MTPKKETNLRGGISVNRIIDLCGSSPEGSSETIRLDRTLMGGSPVDPNEELPLLIHPDP